MATRVETPNIPATQPYRNLNEGGAAALGPPQHRVLGMNPSRVAQGLGWFSIGLGLAELLAPRAVARTVGARNHSRLVRFYGLREILAGVGILTRSNPAPWLWARAAGDMLDLSSLGSALTSRGSKRGLTVVGIASVAGVTALDVMCARELTDRPPGAHAPLHAEANLMINRSPEDCYSAWRKFEDLPRFMHHLQSVRATGDRESHWTGCLPGGGTIEWDAGITEDRPNQRIAWRSLPGSQVTNSGAVDFEPAAGERGTIVRAQVNYTAPGASVASMLAGMLGKNPEQLMYKDLRRFKQYIETGNVITTEGQPAGRRSGATWLDDIAR